MIEAKAFELRDKATFIPIVAMRMKADHVPAQGTYGQCAREHWLLRRAGYSTEEPYLVLLTRLDGGEAHYDPYDWPGRTFQPAHQHIADHWDSLPSGALIDVRVILGEESAPCQSEMAET